MADDPTVRRCRAKTCDGLDGTPRRVVDDRLACPGCLQGSRANLRQLPLRYVRMRRALALSGAALSERVSGPGFKSTAPIRESVLWTMDQMLRWALEAEREVRGTLDLSEQRPGGLPGTRFQRAVTTMVTHLDRAALSPVGVWVVDSSHYWGVRTESLLGLAPLVHRLALPCPACDQRNLVRKDGSDYVQCLSCRNTWSEDQYQHLARVLVSMTKEEA